MLIAFGGVVMIGVGKQERIDKAEAEDEADGSALTV